MYAIALLQFVDEDSYFVLDATAMIAAGWSDEFDDFIEYAPLKLGDCLQICVHNLICGHNRCAKIRS